MRKKAPLKKSIVIERFLSPYAKLLLESVQKLGGFCNAHAHLDRADTLLQEYLEHINTTPIEASFLPLAVKQNLTGDLHRGLAYTKDNLRERMANTLNRLIDYGTTRLCTCIDVASDIGEDGFLALRVALELKEQFRDLIEIEIAPNPIFGFKEGTGRWEMFVEGAKMANFISALPEKDDYLDPRERDGKIGFRNHLRRVIELGCELKKEVHIHLDQANDPNEVGTETLIEGLRWLDQPQISDHKGPAIWAIHSISPSGYSEERFGKLVDGLLELNIGIIICPTAAISMRQLRPINAPVHNSIARMLELCKRGVPVMIGSDNICDVFVPQGDGDILTEIIMGGHALRFPVPYVWAKIGAGVPLNQVDRATIGRALYQDRKSFQNLDPSWVPAID
ncbi:MAG: hypothetical protein PHS29_03310 [Candidatus Pacebacteria bacterium]|nr:hypothetical protein [Candidatus Paceibacterota bacterium]